jgi:hypothetical protein
LQGDRGFHGDAEQLVLQNYQPGSDGSAASVEVVLRYRGSTGSPEDDSLPNDPGSE